MSLRWRIALALGTLAAAATLAAGLISYSTTRNRLYEEVDRSLQRATASLPHTGDRPGRLPDRGVQEVYVQIAGRSGDIEASSSGDTFPIGRAGAEVAGRRGEVRYETVDHDGTELRIRSEGVSFGAVQVARSLEETATVLGDLRRRTAVLVVVLSGAAAVVGWLLARTVTAPLSRLTSAATDVERSGRLDVAVPVKGRDEVGRLGGAFNGMLAALATSRADQRRLVEDAGHELRTPLTSVRTNLAVLRRHPELDAATRDRVLEDIHLETEELVGLVEEVVALARGDSDEDDPVDVQLAEVARGVARRAERRHDRRVVVVADASTVHGQAASIERAISNLVDNACKFDPSDAPIEVHIAGGRVVVHDRGPGLPVGEEARVFDRFYRAEAARSQPGSGLGLSIVREVAERHAGTTFGVNRPGGGASVGFHLPAVATEPAHLDTVAP